MIILSEVKIDTGNKNPGVEIVVCSRRQILRYKDKKNVVMIICRRGTAKALDVETYPNLRVLQLRSAGYESIDLKKFRDHNIHVANVGDCYAPAMAEAVIYGMMLFAKRFYNSPKIRFPRIVRGYRHLEELKGKSVLICGTGNVGRELAQLLKNFNMDVFGYSKHGNANDNFCEVTSSIERAIELSSTVDYFVNLLPINEETDAMINRRFFSVMQRNCVVIGVGRMQTFEQNDLYVALKKRRIRGAVLDIFEILPNPITNRFRRLSNVIVFPSTAAVSIETDRRLQELYITNISNAINENEPIFLIN